MGGGVPIRRSSVEIISSLNMHFCRVFHEVAKIAPLSEEEMDLLRSCKTSGRSVVRYKMA